MGHDGHFQQVHGLQFVGHVLGALSLRLAFDRVPETHLAEPMAFEQPVHLSGLRVRVDVQVARNKQPVVVLDGRLHIADVVVRVSLVMPVQHWNARPRHIPLAQRLRERALGNHVAVTVGRARPSAHVSLEIPLLKPITQGIGLHIDV